MFFGAKAASFRRHEPQNTGCRRCSCDKINPQEAVLASRPFTPVNAAGPLPSPAMKPLRDTASGNQRIHAFACGCIPFSDRNAFFRIAAAPFRMPVRHQNAAHGRQSRFPSLCRHSSPPAGALSRCFAASRSCPAAFSLPPSALLCMSGISGGPRHNRSPAPEGTLNAACSGKVVVSPHGIPCPRLFRMRLQHSGIF